MMHLLPMIAMVAIAQFSLKLNHVVFLTADSADEWLVILKESLNGIF
jgi:hypothetical protein